MKKHLVLFCLALSTLSAVAQQGYVWQVDEQNDSFIYPSTDKHYTQGIHSSLLWPDDQMPIWACPMEALPIFGNEPQISKYGLAFGQEIYTPGNLTASAAQPNDRPYAGWSYLGLIRENRGETLGQLPTLDRYEIDLGVVGPWSLSGNAQNWFHSLISGKSPNGWNNQLSNELGILTKFNRTWKAWELTDNHWGFQVLPHSGINLGNIQTSAQIGTMLKAGYNLPNEFAKTTEPHFGWFIFSDVSGRAVAYNEFLNGNAFCNSPSVTPEPLVLELRGGIALELRHSEIRFAYTYLNKEFKQQSGYDAYGSVDYTYRF